MQNYFIELHQLLFNKQKRKDILLNIAGEKLNVNLLKINIICLVISSILIPIMLNQMGRSRYFITQFKDLDYINTYTNIVVLGFIILFNLFMINSMILNFIIYKLKITKMSLYQLFNIFSYLNVAVFITTIFILVVLLLLNISMPLLFAFIPVINIVIFFLIFLWVIYILRNKNNFIWLTLKYLIILISIIIQSLLLSIILSLYFVLIQIEL